VHFVFSLPVQDLQDAWQALQSCGVPKNPTVGHTQAAPVALTSPPVALVLHVLQLFAAPPGWHVRHSAWHWSHLFGVTPVLNQNPALQAQELLVPETNVAVALAMHTLHAFASLAVLHVAQEP
jgi:hypothetical protein